MSGDGIKIGTAQPLDISMIKMSSKLDSLSDAKGLNKNEKQIEKAAGDFEALLLQQMFASMWASTGSMGEEASREESMFRDMLNQAVANDVSKGKGIGVKDVVLRELTGRSTKSSDESF